MKEKLLRIARATPVYKMLNIVTRDAIRMSLRDVSLLSFAKATQETLPFMHQYLLDAEPIYGRVHHLDFALAQISLDGLWCEFGVFKGGSINFAASKTSKTIYGFDSFEGLPDTGGGFWRKGTWNSGGVPDVKSNVKLYKGWFEHTLPGFLKEHPTEKLAYLHVDCDIYSSTKTVLELMGDRIVPGTVILFDDFINYPTWQEGEYKAWMEFVAAKNVRFECFSYVPDAEQVGMVVRAIG